MFDPSQCYTLIIDGMVVGMIGMCNGGGYDGPGMYDGPGVTEPVLSNEDPCAGFLPTHIPAGADIDKNIKEAADIRKLLKTPGEPGDTAGSVFNVLLWFKEAMANNGAYDYKTKTDSKGQSLDPKGLFGNFNYGAMGAAAELDRNGLLRVAGYLHDDPSTGKGKKTF